MNASGAWTRGYVYAGSGLLAIQSGGSVSWMHEDPVTKSKRVTNSSGTVVSTVELDPWGGDTSRSSNSAFQPKKFTSYERDGNGSDEAMFRRYNRKNSRFDQPDPYDGSYNLGDPQSFNRYAYVQNDPVNFVDPTGMMSSDCVDNEGKPMKCEWNVTVPGGGALSPIDDPTTFTFARNSRFGGVGGAGGGGRGGGGGGGGGGGHETGHIGPQKTETPTPTDCQRFADLVQGIADRINSDNGFLDEMATTFTAANNSSIADMRRNANNRLPAGRPTFGDSGFKPQFQDGSNQVRHFVAGFIAGARGGIPGLVFMNQREGGHNPSSDNAPDVRLNGVSTNLGSMFTGRPDAVDFRRARLAAQIREDLCQ